MTIPVDIQEKQKLFFKQLTLARISDLFLSFPTIADLKDMIKPGLELLGLNFKMAVVESRSSRKGGIEEFQVAIYRRNCVGIIC